MGTYVRTSLHDYIFTQRQSSQRALGLLFNVSGAYINKLLNSGRQIYVVRGDGTIWLEEERLPREITKRVVDPDWNEEDQDAVNS